MKSIRRTDISIWWELGLRVAQIAVFFCKQTISYDMRIVTVLHTIKQAHIQT